jgi:hypothetical protein
LHFDKNPLDLDDILRGGDEVQGPGKLLPGQQYLRKNKIPVYIKYFMLKK